MHQLGIPDLTAGLTGTPSHYPNEASTHLSRIDTCYGDRTTVRVHGGNLRGPPARGHAAIDPSTSTSPSPTYPHPRQPCQTTPSHPHCGFRRRTTTTPGTDITGPDTPFFAALMRQHSPPPCAGRHNHAAWGATPATGEHHRTSLSNSLSMTSAPRKKNSPPCCPPAHRRQEARTPTSASSTPPAATRARNGTPTAERPQPRNAKDTVRQPRPGGQGAPYQPRGAQPREGPHQQPQRRPPGSPGQIPGTTRRCPPRAQPPYQKHHPRKCAPGLQPEAAARHPTRPLQHLRTATRPRLPKKKGHARRRQTPGRSLPTPHPACQVPPGSSPVRHRHGNHTHPP